jgi:hypothetical protein
MGRNDIDNLLQSYLEGNTPPASPAKDPADGANAAADSEADGSDVNRLTDELEHLLERASSEFSLNQLQPDYTGTSLQGAFADGGALEEVDIDIDIDDEEVDASDPAETNPGIPPANAPPLAHRKSKA